MVWRTHIEADDVAHLVDKQWIGGQFEGFLTVRLQAEGAPDALDAEPAAEIAMSTGVRPNIGNVDLDLATSRRKIDAFSIVVNSARQCKTRRDEPAGRTEDLMCRGQLKGRLAFPWRDRC